MEPTEWWDGIKPGTVGFAHCLTKKSAGKFKGKFKITEEGLQWRGGPYLTIKVAMPWPTIQAIDLEGEMSSHLKKGAVLAFGVFGLGARKNQRDTHLTVVMKDDGEQVHEEGFVFPNQSTEMVRNALRPVLQALSQAAPTESPAGDDTEAMSSRGSTVIDQLERLAALHTSGALTDDEFAGEKAKLLGT